MATPSPSRSWRGDPCSVVPRETIILANNVDTAEVLSCICSITDFFFSERINIFGFLISEVTVAQITGFLFTEYE